MKTRHKRMLLILAALVVLGIAATLVLNALNSSIAFFVTPTEIVQGKAPQGRSFRLGGMVKKGSVQRDGLKVHFVITDMVNEVAVVYQGILPDLFKEGKGAVAQGKLAPDGHLEASEVLAKHDENYMPPEAKNAMDKARLATSTKNASK